MPDRREQRERNKVRYGKHKGKRQFFPSRQVSDLTDPAKTDKEKKKKEIQTAESLILAQDER